MTALSCWLIEKYHLQEIKTTWLASGSVHILISVSVYVCVCVVRIYFCILVWVQPGRLLAEGYWLAIACHVPASVRRQQHGKSK